MQTTTDYSKLAGILRAKMRGDEERAQEALCWAWELIDSGMPINRAVALACRRVWRGSLWAERTQGKARLSAATDSETVGAVSLSRESNPARLAQAQLDLSAVRSRLDDSDRAILDGILSGQSRDDLAVSLGVDERAIRRRIAGLVETFASL